MKRNKTERSRAAQSRWPLLMALGGILLVGAAVWAMWGTPASQTPAPEVTGAAKLKADKAKVDVGNVKLGKTVEVSFELANVGDQPLRFTDLPYVEVVEGC